MDHRIFVAVAFAQRRPSPAAISSYVIVIFIFGLSCEGLVMRVESPYKAHLCRRCGVWFFSVKRLSTTIAQLCIDCMTQKPTAHPGK